MFQSKDEVLALSEADRQQALAVLVGSTQVSSWTEDEGQWAVEFSAATVERLGFTLSELEALVAEALAPLPEYPVDGQQLFWDWDAGEWRFEAIPPPELPPELPQVDEFIAEFRTPGLDTVYGSVAQKVAQCSFLTQDHWANFKAVVLGGQVADIPAAINYLAHLLTTEGHPLSAQDIMGSVKAGDSFNGWNTLITQYNFPADCLLEAPS